MLKLYKVVLNNLSKKKKISSNFKWNKKVYTRKDLEKLALININMKKKDVLNRMWILRKLLQPLNPVDSMDFLLNKLEKSETNEEFIASMNG